MFNMGTEKLVKIFALLAIIFSPITDTTVNV